MEVFHMGPRGPVVRVQATTLGAGTFGTVRPATVESVQVALKTSTNNIVAAQEYEILAAVGEHPNIVQLLGGFQFVQNGSLSTAIIMAYCGGGTLLSNMPITDTALFTRYICDVAAGLAYLHYQSIIHRDIKPANILLHEHGYAVLGDLGSAIKLPVVGTENRTTLLYAAPEQVFGYASVGPSSDVFSLAVVVMDNYGGAYGTRRVIHSHNFREHALAMVFALGLPTAVMDVCKMVAPPEPELVGRLAKVPASLRAFVQAAMVYDPRARPDAHNIATLIAAEQ